MIPSIIKNILDLMPFIKNPLKKILLVYKKSRLKKNIDWGDLKSFSPISICYGTDRGRPVDRYYVEKFLEKNSALIGGNCLELMDNRYTKLFGGKKVTSYDILDIEKRNRLATITADLTAANPLKDNYYNCIICTQALYLMYDIKRALKNMCDALKPGGYLLITVPCLVKYHPQPKDCWRPTEYSMQLLLGELKDWIEFSVETYGNLVTCIASLEGMAIEDLEESDFTPKDSSYPLVTCAKVKKVKAA